MGKFVKLDAIKNATEVNTTSQLSDDNIFIGFVTRQTLLKLGDCSPSESRKFHGSFMFLIGDEVLTHARFESCGFRDVEYFIERYHGLLRLSVSDSDQIFDEFVSYQLLRKEDIPKDVWDSAVEESESRQSFVRMDVIWAVLSAMKTGDGCDHRFALLSRIAKLVLILPHSTSNRSSLNLEGTLSQ